MLPHYRLPDLDVGPLTLHSFGMLVAVGIFVGCHVASWQAKKLNLNPKFPWQALWWAIIPGFVVAHLYSIIFYSPDKIVRDPFALINIFDGISSFGGFIGGSLGVIVYLRRQKLPFWPYADILAFGFTAGWIFGRLGCTSVFDHPGLLTDFVLAMPYSGHEVSHGVRHNLGFYEVLWSVALLAFFMTQRNKKRFAGFYLTTFVLAYMPIRFGLDFLRAVDRTYLGLTAGQYGAVALFLLGGWYGIKQMQKGEMLPADPESKPRRGRGGGRGKKRKNAALA